MDFEAYSQQTRSQNEFTANSPNSSPIRCKYASLGAKLSPNNMTLPWYDVQDLQQVLWAKAEGIERRTRLDLLKRSSKTSIWSEEDDEEMTLPDPEVPLVYSLHYAQQGRQDREDELPPETMQRMKNQGKGKRNLHAEEDFVEKLESMNLDPRLSMLLQK